MVRAHFRGTAPVSLERLRGYYREMTREAGGGPQVLLRFCNSNVWAVRHRDGTLAVPGRQI